MGAVLIVDRAGDGARAKDGAVARIYKHFVDYRFVNLRFVYKLNTKPSYSWLAKPKTLKLNAKTGGALPPEPPKLFVARYIVIEAQK